MTLPGNSTCHLALSWVKHLTKYHFSLIGGLQKGWFNKIYIQGGRQILLSCSFGVNGTEPPSFLPLNFNFLLNLLCTLNAGFTKADGYYTSNSNLLIKALLVLPMSSMKMELFWKKACRWTCQGGVEEFISFMCLGWKVGKDQRNCSQVSVR